ncbi:hypothetical protein [Methylocystis heyeri]|uniref:hypothetical protein n=1 Tax=Methylocystis heyeri TaxID=391905 RepID=UPI001133B96B|nr:hypothetical protein [Methylocystis heyeri]
MSTKLNPPRCAITLAATLTASHELKVNQSPPECCKIATPPWGLGSNYESTFHARMEAAGVVDHTWPLQNRLAFGPW